MPTQTPGLTQVLTLSSFGDDGSGNPLVAAELEYDASTGLATLFRVVNNSDVNAYGYVRGISNNRLYSAVFPPGTSTFPIGNKTAERIEIALSGGKATGFERGFIWPYA